MFQRIIEVAGEDPGWRDTLEMLSGQLASAEKEAGINRLGKEGEMLDHSCHEVLSVTETSDPALDKIVEKVHRQGFSEGNKVKRRALVSVYVFKENNAGATKEEP